MFVDGNLPPNPSSDVIFLSTAGSDLIGGTRTVTIENDEGSLGTAVFQTDVGVVGPNDMLGAIGVFESVASTSGEISIVWNAGSPIDLTGTDENTGAIRLSGVPLDAFFLGRAELVLTDTDGDVVVFSEKEEDPQPPPTDPFDPTRCTVISAIPDPFETGTIYEVFCPETPPESGVIPSVLGFTIDVDVEGDIGNINYDSINSIEFRVQFEPEAMVFIDQIDIVELIPQDTGMLAEVDTFTQVSDSGAFAFAESLSALSFEETDTLIF